MTALASPQERAKTCGCGQPARGSRLCTKCAVAQQVLRLSPSGAAPTVVATSAANSNGGGAGGPSVRRDLAEIATHAKDIALPILRVGLAHSVDERSADAAADAFVRRSQAGPAAPTPGHHAAGLPRDGAPPLRAVPSSVTDIVFGGGGKVLEPAIRTPIESHLGTDLGSVRVHTGERAAKSARELGARAYTIGNQVVFNSDQYSPRTPRGQRLLVHELTHVAQQAHNSSGNAALQIQEEGTEAASAPEDAAEQAPPAWKTTLINALGSSIGLPPGSAVLLEQFTEGLGAVAAPQSNYAVTRPPETVQPAASQASAPALSSFAKFNYDFSVIPLRAGMPSPPPKGAVDSPGGIGRRDPGDARRPSIVDDVLASPGHPLDAESRALAEPLFGHDFSHVRVHTGGRAAESARAVDASAYTVGRHVVFGAESGRPPSRPAVASSCTNWPIPFSNSTLYPIARHCGFRNPASVTSVRPMQQFGGAARHANPDAGTKQRTHRAAAEDERERHRGGRGGCGHDGGRAGLADYRLAEPEAGRVPDLPRLGFR